MLRWWATHGESWADEWFAALEGSTMSDMMIATLPAGKSGAAAGADWFSIAAAGWDPWFVEHADGSMSMRYDFAAFFGRRPGD
jgi:hypothetical protein